MGIGIKHLQLVVLLRNNPRATLQQLADQMDVAPNTIRAWIDHLKKENLLRRDRTINDSILGERKVSERVGHPDPRLLGLKRVQVMFREIKTYQNYDRIIKMLDNHPYTYFRARGTAGAPAVYAQFDVPPEEAGRLEELLKLVEGNGWCNSAVLIDHPTRLETKDDFTKWNFDEFKWNFDFIRSYTEYKPNGKLPEPNDARTQFNGDRLDLYLLRELSINSKVKATDLAKLYEKDVATITRRLNKLREKYLTKETIIYNREFFNLNSIFAFSGTMDRNELRKFQMYLHSQNFPFASQFSCNSADGEFLWYVYCPSGIANQIIKIFLPMTQFLDQMVIDPSTSMRYFFYPENYDLEQGRWKGGV
ncbi:MAG: hypothetical protein D6732_16220, partial [Methanobacteriota archaeon]